MIWRNAVLLPILRFTTRHQTKTIGREYFHKEELPQIIQETQSYGDTPEKTLDREMQELRDEGFLRFLGSGKYLLLDKPINQNM